MTRRAERGFSLIEAVITLVVFGVVVSILLALTAEMRGYDKRYPINLMKHPQVNAVLARMRKDVLDAFGPDPYPASYMMHSQSSSKLIVYSVQETGFAQTVVWDFTTPGIVRRQAYSVGGVVTDWTARGVPGSFEVTTFEIPNRPYAVRLKATDQTGRLAIDQILQPRAHN
ncbi:MAG TPA: prepilin-type N-terminal cleavage/methylation domain-containing protein [Thermoanaerobaculia bacterium]|nr:prepilin-type N-terminal cleavage/methylation domain-containing protein [Thermoanaerobaculia bacterium]